MITWHPEQCRKNKLFLCGKEFYLFYLSFSLVRLKKWEENRKEEPLLLLLRSSTFCERSPWCSFNRSVFFRTTERKWSQKKELRLYTAIQIPLYTNASFPRFLLFFFPLCLILILYIISLCSRAQSSTIKKVIPLQTRVAIYIYVEWNILHFWTIAQIIPMYSYSNFLHIFEIFEFQIFGKL